jgi:hypothetical protein
VVKSPEIINEQTMPAFVYLRKKPIRYPMLLTFGRKTAYGTNR